MAGRRRLDTMGSEMLYEELSGTILGAAMEVHKQLGAGFLESVYEHAPALEPAGRKIPFVRQAPIRVMYKGEQVGEYRADPLVDGKIILEIKATAALIAEHLAPALHYLTATELRLALLLNFGTKSLQFKRIIR
jgi:GxxExxY protein